MSAAEFLEFPKIGRLSRDVVVTEKIDGTNAQVLIVTLSDEEMASPDDSPYVAVVGRNCLIYAGSRNRWLTPGTGREAANDNFGFAAWVRDHAADLATLGEGRHYGEWWGSGIQRGYGLSAGEKRFSLFNVARWGDDRDRVKFPIDRPACCGVVPVLYRGDFDGFMGHSWDVLDQLRTGGSLAAPGFMKPEGLVVFHSGANVLFKKTIDGDEVPKSRQQEAA